MLYDVTPRVYHYGELRLSDFSKSEDQKLVSFYLMPFYDLDLKRFLGLHKGLNKMEKIMGITIKILNILKYVHCAKRTYNDLKPSNIMVNTNGKPNADPDVFLIDFGFADKFIT